MTSGTSAEDETSGHTSDQSDARQRTGHKKAPHELRRIAVSVILFAFVFHFFVLPIFSNFGKTWKAIETINLALFIVAIAVEFVSWYFGSEVTRLLLPAKQRPSRVYVYESNIAANGVSEVLPGGVAATAVLDYGLLRRAGVAKGHIVYALGAAGIIGIVTMIGLGAIAVLATASRARHIQDFALAASAAALALMLVAAAVWAIINRTSATAHLLGRAVGWIPGVHRQAVEDWVGNTADQLHQLLSDRRHLARLVAVSAAQWITECVTAWVVFAALGHHLNIFELFVAYAVAVGAAALPISPGGLGVFEGTMIAVLVVFGSSHAIATAGVLAFRVINYWLPIPVGALADWLAHRSTKQATAA